MLGGCGKRASESAQNRAMADAPRLDLGHPALTLSTSPADAAVGPLAPQVTAKPTTQVRSECADLPMITFTYDGRSLLDERFESLREAQRAGNPQCAWRIVGATACHLNDLKLANDAYRRLNPQHRDYLVHVCEQYGIRLLKGHFR